MRICTAVLVAVVTLAASAAHAGVVAVDPATKADRPVNWRWAAKPDAFKMALIMSTVSRHDAHVGDVGRVECVIGELRRPVDCRTLSEPPGSRLAAATARLAYYYKAPARDEDGKSPVGRTVRVSFTLTAPGGFE
jgi:hypothetical protein